MQPPLLPPSPPWLPELLAALGDHDCLALHQLAALLGRDAAEVAPVLDRLVRDRHVQALESAATRSKAYVLAVRGARLYAELTGEEPISVGRTRSTAILDHDLFLNDLAVVLQLLDAEGRIKLLRWETSRDALADAVHVVRGKRTERVALVADGLAVIATPTGPTSLLAEIDMGTVSLSRMATKYAGYAAWWRAKGPERRFGLRSLRVLTIAKHEARMARLRAAAAEAGGSEAQGLFWFATADVLDADAPEKLLGPRFWTARPDTPLPAALFSGVYPSDP